MESTDGILAYGYNLDGSDNWKIREAGEYGELPTLPWYDPDAEDGDDFQAAAKRRLLAEIAGFTETDWRADGHFARKREAEARLGVKFDTHCSGDYPMLLLAAKIITVYRGHVEEIDMPALTAEAEAESWDDKLTAALRVLGITPTQERAKWLLCSYWG